MKFSVSLILLCLSAVFRLSGQHSFNYPSPVCQNGGTIAPITSPNFTAGGVYSSNGSGLSLNVGTGIINLATSTVGMYTVTYAIQTAAPVTATIQILPPPSTISVSGNTICASATGSQFTLVATSADPSMSYVWLPFGSSGNTFNAPFGVSTYTVVGTVGTCTTHAIVTTSLTAAVVPTITGAQAVCAGAVYTLSASGGVSYTWSSGALTPVMTDTAPATSGFYTVTVNSIDGQGCEGVGQHNLSVIALPNVMLVNPSPTVCTGYGYSLTATGANTYTWYPGLKTGASVNFTPTAPVTTYTVVGNSGGCTNIAVHTVSWVPLPVIQVVGSPSMCAGQTITLQGSSPNGFPTYTWTSPPNIKTFADSVQISPPVTSSYTLAGTIGDCASTVIHKVTVFPRPNMVILPATKSVCSGVGITFTATNAQTYTWSTGAQTNTLFVNPPRDTTFYVTGTNANGCRDTKTVDLTVLPSPTITVNSASICAGETATLDVVSEPDEAATYFWLPPQSVNASTIFVKPLQTTNYTLTVTLGNKCSSKAFPKVTVTPTVNASVFFRYDGPYCNGSYSAVPILPSSFTKGGSFFTFGDLPVNEQTGVVPLNNVNQGIYSVSYSVATQGCTLQNTGSANFLIDESITLTAVEHIEILPGQEVTLQHSGGASKYSWYPPVDLDCSSCEYPVATPMQSTNYCVKSGQPCVSGTCIMVEVLCINYGDLSVPNAFTPNNDGRNDKFCLLGWAECNIEFNITIFDRWGTKVYESSDPSFCWDGTFNGAQLPSAVYMYQINAQFKKEPAIKKSGNISLIR